MLGVCSRHSDGSPVGEPSEGPQGPSLCFWELTHSMDRCAVFVDAGYLYAEGGKLSGIGPSRRNVRLDALRANEFLVGLATTACRLPVLRTYWYDGARDRIPTAEHQAISDLPNVKLRLGRLNQRHQQKGVDALIYHDLMTLARERAVSAAYLLSGDEDLREGVRAAQEIGVRVTLVEIRTPSGARNQSRDLAREADEILMLTKEDLSGFIVEAPDTGEARRYSPTLHRRSRSPRPHTPSSGLTGPRTMTSLLWWQIARTYRRRSTPTFCEPSRAVSA